MSNMFDIEFESFQKTFSKYRDKKIVLYGIGRRTAALVSHNIGFDFVGLMDRDIDYLGKKMYGLPIISLDQAEKQADIIIINAPRTYWEIIYKRISHSKIPIFYLNGETAKLHKYNYNDKLSYWNLGWNELKSMVKNYEIILFDIFDVLLMRRIINFEDKYTLLNIKLHKERILDENFNFIEMRNRVIKSINCKEYTIDDVYMKLQEMYLLSNHIVEQIKKMEIDIEKTLLVPRIRLIEEYKNLQLNGKDIYIISDEYYSKETIKEIFIEHGLEISYKQILVSPNLEIENKNIELWKKLAKNKRCIYINNKKSGKRKKLNDIGIDSFFIMSAKDMLKYSSINSIYEKITDVEDSLIVGTLIGRLYNDPFVLNKDSGNVYFDSCVEWGYCIWGNIVFTFIEWLIENSKKAEVERLFFLARDGYLLKQDYDFYISIDKNEKNPKSNYLYTSRRLAYFTAIFNEKDYMEWSMFPYNGTFADYMEDRFSISIDKNEINAKTVIQIPNDINKVKEWMHVYEEEIINQIINERKYYINYLEKFKLNRKDAVVDTGFYGNIQDKLNKILEKNIIGFYFTCYLDKSNECNERNVMIPCFQGKSDICAKKSKLRDKAQLVESVFTAPYGMIIKIDVNGEKVCTCNGKNQDFFDERNKINTGIKEFIKDMLEIKKRLSIDKFVDKGFFADFVFGIMVENSKLDEKISSKFVWDDTLVHKRQNPIFM